MFIVSGLLREIIMKKFLAGLALSAALVAGSATTITTPASAAVYVHVGSGGGYYWHHRHWHSRYRCHHGWCYR
jgi:hypothetical protein